MADKKNNITVLGVGRLGLCFALKCAHKGYNVFGVDVIPSYVQALNDKTFKSDEPLVTQYLNTTENFKASLSLDEGLEFSDQIFLLLATPTGVGEHSYDHTMLSKLLQQINDRKVKNKQIVIGCTVLPGYIAGTARFLISDCEGSTLSYNPEFIAQGNIMNGLAKPDMVLIGQANDEVGKNLEEFYIRICDNEPLIHRMSPESAEITKLAVNCFLTTKIAFANMVGDIANATPNANAVDILSAVGDDSRIGKKYLASGYGFGGPCFPRDNRALGNYSNAIGIEPIIPFATDNSNKYHAKIMIENFLKENKDEYVFENVAYKNDCEVPIIEESQKLVVARGLVRHGKKVIIRDNEKIIRCVQAEYGGLFTYEKK